jgi:hypothetical protein
MKKEQPVNDIRSCYYRLRQSGFEMTVAEFNRIPLEPLSPSTRATLYGVLLWSLGRVGHSLHFLGLAKESALDDDEIAYVLHIEGIILFAAGDSRNAIGRQRECVDLCRTVKDKQLAAAALSRLSIICEAIGDKELAAKYEKRAARFMLQKDYI